MKHRETGAATSDAKGLHPQQDRTCYLSIRTAIVVALSRHSTTCALENSLDFELATTSWLGTTPWFIGWPDLISVLSLDNFEGYLPMLPVSNGESGQVGSMFRTASALFFVR